MLAGYFLGLAGGLDALVPVRLGVGVGAVGNLGSNLEDVLDDPAQCPERGTKFGEECGAVAVEVLEGQRLGVEQGDQGVGVSRDPCCQRLGGGRCRGSWSCGRGNG
ncbi:hypothetical protein AB0C27_56015 [Nonomuraea sp. NPDC048882]|uniref:hypothetical protein n=1 Tax=Nonomuraea sp. NPDC048882 TaxID=3154347 RepID=UPI0034020E20